MITVSVLGLTRPLARRHIRGRRRVRDARRPHDAASGRPARGV